MKNIIVSTLGFLLVLTSAVNGADAAKPKHISNGRYIAGGIVGTAVGFGIGHAVQGSYGEIGWVFTAGEVAGLSMMIAGLSLGISRPRDGNDERQLKAIDKTLIFTGLATQLGFHIWEVVDVWTRIPEQRELAKASEPSFMVLPTVASNSAFGLTAALRF